MDEETGEGRTFRHTCPACGDMLAGASADAVIDKAREHARLLHDLDPLQHISLDEFRAAIRLEYERYWALVEHLITTDGVATVLEARLGERERQVVDFVVHGFSNREIAQRLCISQRTVSTHLENIYRKLDVRSRAALVATVRAADRTIQASMHAFHVHLGPFVQPADRPRNT